MKLLELTDHPVEEIRFAPEPYYRSGVLHVNKDELLAIAMKGQDILSASLALAHPGDTVRITGIREVVDPRSVGWAELDVPRILTPLQP